MAMQAARAGGPAIPQPLPSREQGSTTSKGATGTPIWSLPEHDPARAGWVSHDPDPLSMGGKVLGIGGTVAMTTGAISYLSQPYSSYPNLGRDTVLFWGGAAAALAGLIMSSA